VRLTVQGERVGACGAVFAALRLRPLDHRFACLSAASSLTWGLAFSKAGP
jgi:hypothetical protein